VTGITISLALQIVKRFPFYFFTFQIPGKNWVVFEGERLFSSHAVESFVALSQTSDTDNLA
jgi:hypothetical protein